VKKVGRLLLTARVIMISRAVLRLSAFIQGAYMMTACDGAVQYSRHWWYPTPTSTRSQQKALIDKGRSKDLFIDKVFVDHVAKLCYAISPNLPPQLSQIQSTPERRINMFALPPTLYRKPKGSCSSSRPSFALRYAW